MYFCSQYFFKFNDKMFYTHLRNIAGIFLALELLNIQPDNFFLTFRKSQMQNCNTCLKQLKTYLSLNVSKINIPTAHTPQMYYSNDFGLNIYVFPACFSITIWSMAGTVGNRSGPNAAIFKTSFCLFFFYSMFNDRKGKNIYKCAF